MAVVSPISELLATSASRNEDFAVAALRIGRHRSKARGRQVLYGHRALPVGVRSVHRGGVGRAVGTWCGCTRVGARVRTRPPGRLALEPLAFELLAQFALLLAQLGRNGVDVGQRPVKAAADAVREPCTATGCGER